MRGPDGNPAPDPLVFEEQSARVFAFSRVDPVNHPQMALGAAVMLFKRFVRRSVKIARTAS